MNLIPSQQHCPYCDADIELLIEPDSHGVEYIEDCQVCCRPIRMRPWLDADGELQSIELLREDD